MALRDYGLGGQSSHDYALGIDQKEEKITNLRRIPDKVIEGTTITDFEIEVINWEAHIEEHRKRI